MSRPFRLAWNTASDVRPTESNPLVIPFRWLPVGTAEERLAELHSVLAESGFRHEGQRLVRVDGGRIRIECDTAGQGVTVSVIRTETRHSPNDFPIDSGKWPDDMSPPDPPRISDCREYYELLARDWQHRVTARLLVHYAARLGQIESVRDEPGRTTIVVEL